MIALGVLLKIILLEVFLMKIGICEYTIAFNEGMSSCKGFKNEKFDGDMQLGTSNDGDGDYSMYLQGFIEIKEPVKKGYLFEIDISKETEVGSEPMWSCALDVCSSIEDNDASWSAAFELMKMQACPIETGLYNCSNFAMDMSFMDEKLSHEYEGDYDVVMRMIDDNLKTISCHKVGLAIQEKDRK